MKKFVFLIILFSCGIENTENNGFLVQKLEKAEQFYINLDYHKADTLLISFEDDVWLLNDDDPLLHKYVLLRIKNQRNLRSFDLRFVEKCLTRFKSLKDEFYYKIILEKSAYLTEKSLANAALATSAYALTELIKLNVPDSTLATAYLSYGINLIREFIYPSDSIMIEKAWTFCIDSTIDVCRKIKVLQLYKKGVSSISSIDPNTLSYLIHPIKKSPELDKFIYTTLGWMMRDIKEQQYFLGNLPHQELDDICTNAFWTRLYMIDGYIESHDFKSADSLLVDWQSKCTFNKSEDEYLLQRQLYKYNFEKYKIFCDIRFLKKALDYANKSMESSALRFTNDNTLHFADFVHDTKIDVLEMLYQLQNEGQNITNYLYLNICQGKTQYNNPVNQSINFNSEDKIENYIQIIENINHLEVSLNEFKDSIIRNSDIYSKLYHLHDQKYKIEQQAIGISKKQLPLRSLIEFQNNLVKTNSQILDFSMLGPKLFMTVIRPDTIYIEKIVDNNLKNEINLTLDMIKKKENISPKFSNFIINNIDFSLPNIFIAGDQEFSNFPFEIIHVQNNSTLIDFCNISYTSDILRIPTYDPNLKNDQISLISYSDEETLKGKLNSTVSELPLGMKEVKHLSNKFKNAIQLYGLNLTKNSLLKQLNSSIIHFAVHSNSNPDNLLENYLYVRDKSGDPLKLYGFEIVNKNVKSDLVVLSSCNSGTGAYKPGAGTFSISRDFLNAGAQTVVKSLWPVNEVSTSLMMEYFYNNLFEGKTVGESLTKAKIKLKSIQKFSAPYYWAPFVTEGNPYLKLSDVN